ncbi:proline--tRNA ligase [Candidatus Microgenomates bacterium]|nr:MAG: proline--tRNA ligase [Candidatus Microgenomates bacterium]
MKCSKLFTKTNKNVKEMASKNAMLLQKAGYIDQVMAGVYTFLPLGLRVLQKIEAIVREEMDTISNEVLLPSIVPIDLWKTTKRFDTVDVLMKTTPANEAARAKNDAEYVLNSTHEDTITPLVQKFSVSYKDLPVAIYQIQTKFRNEPRAKSGLLRCREFRMKDLYSFHESEADLKAYYEVVKKVYTRIFDRLGLGNDTMIALASGGDFTKEYSHEFQTRCAAGEDTIFFAQKAGIAFNKEVAPSLAPEIEDVQEAMKPREDVLGKGIIGVEELASFLKIPVAKTTKTLLFEDEDGNVIAAAVRGGYDINEEKLKKASGVKRLTLARSEVVKKITGAEVGYAGILNLPDSVRIFMDESMKGRRNFEMGANKSNHHSVNINFGRDLKEPAEFFDIKIARDGDRYPETGETYEVFSAAEVGNIFPLNTKFSNAFEYNYIDEKGKQQPVYMGSYGLGTSRVMGVLVEKFADAKGLVWPSSVAPFQVHLISLSGADDRGQEVYDALVKNGIEVLWDDRDESAGVKFADCDLIGIPYRLVVSKKTGNQVEVKKRNEEKSSLTALKDLITLLNK